MKRKVPATYSLFLVIACAILFLSNNSNPPNGYTGAPPNGQTCAACHSGGSPSGNVAITGLPATITPDQVYPITVTVTRTTGTPQKAGFQMTVLDGNNTFAGIFSSPSAGTTVQSQLGIFYFEHNPGQNFGAGNTLNFTVNWRAPATGSGPITMYAAANLANNNNNTTGDFITTTVASGTLDATGGPVISNVSSTPVFCFGGSNGSATANPTGGGGGPYTYLWSTGSTQQTINNLSAGTYSVTIMSGGGETGIGMTTVGSPPQLFVNITASGNISCATPNGFATAQASGGAPGYTYAWSTGASGPSAVFTNPGTYFVTATDASQCPVVTSVTITANTAPPTAIAGPDRIISCTSPTATLNGAGSSTGAGISYQWTGPGIVSGGTTLTPVVNAAGTYTLTVTNQSSGCTGSDQVVVTGSIVPPTANAGPDRILTCTNMTAVLNGGGSSSGANITYAWTGPGIVSGGTTNMPVVNVAGTYTLTVNNQTNGCSATDQVVVTSNTAPPIANAGANMTISCPNPTVTLNGTGSTSGANITYGWTGPGIVSGGATTTPVVNAAGTYTLTVTNQTNGCSASDQVVVSGSTTPPTANAGPGQTLTCTTTTVTLDGTGSSSGASIIYAWTGPGIVSGGTTATPVVNAAGTYTLTVTNQSTGCSATSPVVVVSNTTLPIADAGADTSIACTNATVQLDGSGSSSGPNFTYDWAGPGIVSGDTTATPIVNMAGTYVLTVTNQTNGCFASDSVLVTANTIPPVANAGPDMTITCAIASVTLNGTGSASGANITYAWAGPGIVSGGTTNSPVVNAPGAYTLTVTNQANGCSASDQVIVESNTAPPTANAGPGQTLTCTTTSVTLNGSGSSSGAGIVYGWTGPGIVSGGTTNMPIVNVSGTYTLTVTNQSTGCSANSPVAVLRDTIPPTANAGADLVITCGNTSGTLNGSSSSSGANILYSWSGPGILSGGATTMPLVNLAGTYTLIVTNQSNGCSATDQAAVVVNTMLGLDVQTTPANCFGAATGSATALASGGNGNYAYIWSTGATTTEISGLAAGTYPVTATNGNCSATGSATVSQPAALIVNVMTTAETSPGASDGTATAMATGGTPDYTYLWSTGAVTAAITGLAPGNYSVTASDSQGCTASTTAEVNSSICNGFVLELTPADLVCHGDMSGSVEAALTGGTGPFSFEWSNGGTGPTISGLAAGVYSVSATDANDCILTASTAVEEPTALELTIQKTDVLCPGDATGTAEVNVSGGTSDYTFDWSTGETTDAISQLTAGDYSIVVTDAKGCEAEENITIALLPDLTPPLVVVQPLTIYLDAAGQVEITPEMADNGSSDNCGIVVFQLSQSQFFCDETGTQSITFTAIDAAGNATTAGLPVTVLDTIAPDLQCFAIETLIGCSYVIEYELPVILELCDDQFFEIPVELVSGLPGGSVFPTGETLVTYQATDPSGNTATCSFTVSITEPPAPEAELVAPLCAGSADGSITVLPFTDPAGNTYQWDDPLAQTDAIAVGLSAGTYSVIVSGNSNGCVDTLAFILEDPEPIQITLDELLAETSTNMDGAISVTASGGQGEPYTYIWRFNGQVVSMEEDLTGLAMGQYLLTVVDFNGCVAFDTFVVDRITNALEPALDYSLLLYPNPAENGLNIQITGEKAANLELALLDFDGRLLKQPMQAFSAKHTFALSVADYAPGIYLARIIIDDQVLWRRVVVER